MKLLMLTEYFAPHHGGTAVYYHEVLRRCTQFDVTVITRRQRLAQDTPRFPSHLHVISTPFPSIPKIRMLIEWLTHFLIGLAVIVRKRPDVLLAGQVYPLGLAVYTLHRITGIPYLLFLHGEDIAQLVRRPVSAGAVRRVVAHAGAVIVNSAFTAGLVRTLGIRSEGVHVVHPAVDASRFTPGDGTDFRRRHHAEGAKVLLTVGRLIPRKGYDTVIGLLPSIQREVPGAVYWVVGSGSQEEHQRLMARARADGVESRVRFLGDVSDAELPEVYRACDVFVMLNRTTPEGDVEGFGMVFLEASASGKPVIAGQSGGAAEAVRNEYTGLVIPADNEPAAVSACIKVLQDPELREKFGANGRQWASGYFSWDRAARMIAEIAQSLRTPVPLDGAEPTHAAH